MDINAIQTVAVLGAGTMGLGIAQSFAQAGYQVNLFDISDQALERAPELMRANLQILAKHGLIAEEEIAAIIARISCFNDLEAAVASVQLVEECVFEKPQVKSEVFAKLDSFCPDDVIIASNTSYLNIYELVPAARKPNTVIAHWFAPAHIVPLVELVKGEQTAPATVDTVKAVLEKIGKTPVVMERFVPGFAINRIQRILGREIFFLLDNGYMTAEELDKAVKASIAPRMMVLGLVQRYDFTGIDLSVNNLKNPDYLEPPIDNSPKSLCSLYEQGDLGVKTGKGFYDYGDDMAATLAQRDDDLIRAFISQGQMQPIGTARS